MEQKEQKELKTMKCVDCGQLFTGDGCRKSWIRHQRNTHKIDLKVSKGPNSTILDYIQPTDRERIDALEREVKSLKECIVQLQNVILGKTELKAPIDPIQLVVEEVKTITKPREPEPEPEKPKKTINLIGTVGTVSTVSTQQPIEWKSWDEEDEYAVVIANHTTREKYETSFRTTMIKGKEVIHCYLFCKSLGMNKLLGVYNFDPDDEKKCFLSLEQRFMSKWLDKIEKTYSMTICLLEDDVLFLTTDNEVCPGWQLALTNETDDYTILNV